MCSTTGYRLARSRLLFRTPRKKMYDLPVPIRKLHTYSNMCIYHTSHGILLIYNIQKLLPNAHKPPAGKTNYVVLLTYAFSQPAVHITRSLKESVPTSHRSTSG
ncbi:hypothetical protein EVAR_36298_1 [Eumeta japonica]|uniref:Uncharacterized protein n=1 Tax=Eumeta variegata TaxID=151549 RepID=A0A4C1VHC7_EUMVA|nr:hypothetical protein EVAR_36298_1 [Eumeta japonica]